MTQAERRHRTRTSILDALEAELLDHPDDPPSVDQIARRAGVSTGTIYVHFANRSQVALALALSRVAVELETLSCFAPGPHRVLALGDLLVLAAQRTPAAAELLRQHPDGYDEITRRDDPLAKAARRLTDALRAMPDDLAVADDDLAARPTATFVLAAQRGLLELAAGRARSEHLASLSAAWAEVRRAIPVENARWVS